MADTIFALSSGPPPAAIAVVRISGPDAGEALERLAGARPEPARASLRRLRDGHGEVLDRALVLWFPGPASSTGEDLAELHIHGGRAVVAGVDRVLATFPGLRRATSGEFTRRAFQNGRIDLAEAEGLADLLSAETDLQRRCALSLACGALSRQAGEWRDRLLDLSAAIEATLDFSGEDDVERMPPEVLARTGDLAAELRAWASRPRADILREGFRVVLGGPPNAGKSTLFNALVDHEAAITSDIAGTTRDVLTRTVALEGIAFQFFDTAGVRGDDAGEIERLGIERARAAFESADLVLWLGPEGRGPPGAWEIDARCDVTCREIKRRARHLVSAVSGQGMSRLRGDLVETARLAMPRPGEVALNARQQGLIEAAAAALDAACGLDDPLLVAEELRLARVAFDRLLGRAATEDMLDTLFGRFCIGK